LKLPQSAPADVILVLIVFDLTIMIEPGQLLVELPDVRTIYGVVTLLCMIMWVIAIGRLERDLHKRLASRANRGYPYFLMFASLGVSGLALILNLAPIALRSLS